MSAQVDQPEQSKLNLLLHYVNEREAVRQRKERSDAWPWTTDQILQTIRFTNVKRAHDKTTRYFKENFYDNHRNRPYWQILLNCGIFRYTGTMGFADAIGWQHKWDPGRLVNVAAQRKEQGLPVFTSAYIITNNGIKAPKEEVVFYNFLQHFYNNVGELARICHDEKSWRKACEFLRTVPGFRGSGFMAKEVLQDAILTPVLEDCSDKETWTPVGPGARRGLNWVFGRPFEQDVKDSSGKNDELYLAELKLLKEYVNENKESYVPHLDMHDAQFLMCEIAKYVRVMDGGKAKRGYKPPKDVSMAHEWW